MISVENLSVQFNGDYLFQNLSFKLSNLDRIGVVGPNGCGKTTLLKIIAGLQSPESGSINYQKGISVGFLQQDYISELSGKTLYDEVYSGNTKICILENEEQALIEKLRKDNDEILIKRLGEVHHKLEAYDVTRYKSDVKKILKGLGFKEKDFYRDAREFSGGWRMRIALAKLLCADHNLVLLDEPTNHLDLDSLEFVIGFLRKFKGAVMIVSHDRHFLKSVTNKTLGFLYNEVQMVTGDVFRFQQIQEEKREQMMAAYRNQQLKIKQIERFVERFRYKATKARQVQSRLKLLDKIDRIEPEEDEKSISFNFNTAPDSGKVVMTLSGISKSYNEPVIEDGELEISRGDKIAVLGANGTGKTTLAKIIAGKETFQSGSRVPGHNVIIGYYSQDVAENLDRNLTVLETVENIDQSKTTGELRTILGCFLFHGDDIYKKVDILSGGEKSRLALAKILLTPCNLLIMDEPTNHLDMQSKKILQEALIDFNGTLMIVSHDIDFLEPIINKILEIKERKPKIILLSLSDYMKKYSEEENAGDEPEKEKSTDIRKVQKRIEAEQRQKLYNLTKDIKKEIDTLEKEIFRLEEIKKSAEAEMSKEDFNKRENLSEFFAQYNRSKKELEDNYSRWEKLSEELHDIEEKFRESNT